MQTAILTQMIQVPFREKGRDLSGFDCWGAVRYGLEHLHGIEVPSYIEDYVSPHEGQEIAGLIQREAVQWVTVTLAAARAGDVLVLKIQNRPWHCGLVIEPPQFLHALAGAGTVMERWDGPMWAQRIVAAYRHPALMWLDGNRSQ